MSTSTLGDEFVCEQCGHPVVSPEHGAACLHCLLNNGITSDARTQRPHDERHTYQHYEILRRQDGSLWELGRNAVSVTYKARDMNLDMVVALKVLNPDLSQDPEVRTRFLLQAQAMAQIRHPNVANVIQFGITPNSRPTVFNPNGQCFYTMEFIEGETHEARVTRDGPLSPMMATKLALETACALALAETRGISGYRVRPRDIMLDDWGETSPDQRNLDFNPQLSARIINLGLWNSRREAIFEEELNTEGYQSSGPCWLSRGQLTRDYPPFCALRSIT
jgi:hypothetical protein